MKKLFLFILILFVTVSVVFQFNCSTNTDSTTTISSTSTSITALTSTTTSTTIPVTTTSTYLSSSTSTSTTTTTTTTITPPSAPIITGLANGSYNTNQTFTVTGSDSLSYTLDNGTNWINYSVSVTISDEGTYTIKAIATNSGGSTESTVYTIIIDKTPPALKTNYIGADYVVIVDENYGNVASNFTDETNCTAVFDDVNNKILVRDSFNNKIFINNVNVGKNWIAFVISNILSNETFYITKGNYILDNTLAINKNINIFGDGDNTIITVNNNFSDIIDIQDVGGILSIKSVVFGHESHNGYFINTNSSSNIFQNKKNKLILSNIKYIGNGNSYILGGSGINCSIIYISKDYDNINNKILYSNNGTDEHYIYTISTSDDDYAYLWYTGSFSIP